jgi:heme A synthase
MIADSIVDWHSLGQAVLSSVVIGLGVLLVAGLAVVASLRAQDERAKGREGAVIAFGAVTVLCVIGILGAIAAGIWAMAQ